MMEGFDLLAIQLQDREFSSSYLLGFAFTISLAHAATATASSAATFPPIITRLSFMATSSPSQCLVQGFLHIRQLGRIARPSLARLASVFYVPRGGALR